MLGAIVGDIVGSRFEFNNTKRTDFRLLTPQCGYTDDTICTVAVAEAMLRGRNYGECIHEWCNRYPHPMGAYGGRFAQWVASPSPSPYGSFGNGSAMRSSPIGWMDAPLELVLEQAQRTAECSHNHPEGIRGAQCIAACVWWIRRNSQDKQGLRGFVAERFGYSLEGDCDTIRATNRFDETCQVTVPQAIIAYLEGESFEEVLHLAISLGGDSDTIGDMAGALAHAHYGIPTEIAQAVETYLPEDMLTILAEFDSVYMG
ncbi:MAG: ADP-ribosylglycohydrolase [Bacteroidetes bacterium]|nr:MAG: ADP-ribosylglycohydrolase [Bacteroidota bacterium]